jgi:predicted transcriptional regulator
METRSSKLSVDDVFKALSNAERRKLLDSLIADSPPDDAASSGIKIDANVMMRHSHLPQLADYGLINWDRDACRVTKGPHFEAAAEILSFLEDKNDVLSLEGAAE